MCLPLVVTQRNLLWYIVLIWGTWTRTFRSFPWINHNVILLQPAHTHNQEQQHNNIQHFFNIIYPADNFPVIGKVESCKYFVWVWDTLACDEYLRMCLPLSAFHSLKIYWYIVLSTHEFGTYFSVSMLKLKTLWFRTREEEEEAKR